jgi:hypothetical protein
MAILAAILLLDIELVALAFEKLSHKSQIACLKFCNRDVNKAHPEQFFFRISAQYLIPRIRHLEASTEIGDSDPDGGILKHPLPSALG